MAFAGAGPGGVVAVLQKHLPRVCHVHCKDVRPHVLELARANGWSFLQSVLNGAFTVPGDGAIDFSAVLSTLAARRLLGLVGRRSGAGSRGRAEL